ncbi:MAG: J domain-containing protein [Bdellovibrionota bacterium]|nr:MAG: J domain-containing protein [Bdellovibrionota bacterium]
MNDLESKNFYDLLGVTRTATKEEIRAAYKEIARVYHPDSNFYSEIVQEASLSSEQIQIFKRITEAYNTLVNDDKRAEYDSMLPGNLPSWDADDEWSPLNKYHDLNQATKSGKVSYAFGTFGMMQEKPKSAFEETAESAPVSEIIRMKSQKQGLWQRLMAIFGF